MAAEPSCRKRSWNNLTIILLLLFLHETACSLVANCSISGCSNGGTCIHTPNTNLFACTCTTGYTGSLCKISTSVPSAPCSGSPCLNGGLCQILMGKSMCICVDPWQGDHCEQLRDSVPIGIVCGSQEMKCASGQCLNHRLWCDGGRDCSDGSDEKDCTGIDLSAGCKSWQFNCGDGANCVPVDSRCNKIQDCDNAADEYGCGYPITDLTGPVSGQCGRLEFRCDDGRCIIGRARCNGSPDCRDGSDEKNCAYIVANPPCSMWEFDCGDGTCVDRRGRCDRYPDCQNEADEANCDSAHPGKLPSEEQPMPGTPIHPGGNSLNLVDILIVSCAMLMAFVAITIFVYLRRVRRMHQRYFAAVGGSPTATTSTRHRHYRRQQGTPYRLSHHSTFCHHLPPHRCPASSNLLVSYNLHSGAEVVGRGATCAAGKDETDCVDEVPPAYSEVIGASGTWTRDGSVTPPPAYEDLPSAFRH